MSPVSVQPGPTDPAGSMPGAALPEAEVLELSSAMDVFHNHLFVFMVAFVVTLLATPVCRRLAIANGVIDRPNESRKVHKLPVAYLGGVAVFVGLMAAVAFSYIAPALWMPSGMELFEAQPSAYDQRGVPLSIILGMTVIMITGLYDDVAALSPRIKIGGQLFAAGALAIDEVGTKVAAGLLRPVGRMVGNQELQYSLPMPGPLAEMLGHSVTIDLIYWAGVAIIAIFVLGACNASNLVDGLDGLLSGVTAISAAALLVIALGLAAIDDGPRDSARVTLCLALLGACLGFLPHNFNPATIFLGDAGSLLLGYTSIVIILSLGDTGKTHMVIAGLVIFAIPIIDTVLALVRRKLAGRPFFSPDDQHLHHMLKRALGVKGAVLSLYAIGAVFGGLGIWLSTGRVRVVVSIALVIAAFIAVTAVKVARRQMFERQAAELAKPLSELSGRPSVETQGSAAPVAPPASPSRA